MDRLYRLLDSRLLRRARAVTATQAIPPELWDAEAGEADACNLFVFFNLESAFAMGHSILGLARNGGPVETFSFSRRARKVIAPAKVATIREEITFDQIVERGGWILHGREDDIWYEHMTCCLALECPQRAYERALAFFRAVAEHPGTYGLITRNCIHICRQALAAGGVHVLDGRGRPFRTILPRHVYLKAAGAKGARAYRAWRYWFPLAEPPRNPQGYRVRPVKMPALMGPLDE